MKDAKHRHVIDVVPHMFNIGIIGNGSQSKRVQKILKKKKLNFFVYKPKKPFYFEKKNFNILKQCKIIFILSPNKTHFSYIKKLYKNRYIFCEKPPCINIIELKKLTKLKNQKIFFNFNFRFSFIAKILSKLKNYNLGKLITINFNIAHGLAYKKEYKNNWRSVKSKNPLGVLEMVLVHYIDLINYFFKIRKVDSLTLKNYSNIGNSYDTCKISYILNNDAQASFFGSYSSPYYKNNLFIFKNGYIEQSEKDISIRGPAINLNKKGFFIKPKLIKNYKINEIKDYNNSLAESVNFFLNSSLKNKKIPVKMFLKALETNKLLFVKK